MNPLTRMPGIFVRSMRAGIARCARTTVVSGLLFATACGLGLGAVGFLTAALYLWLQTMLEPAAAALIMGGLLLFLGAIALMCLMNRVKAPTDDISAELEAIPYDIERAIEAKLARDPVTGIVTGLAAGFITGLLKPPDRR